MHGVHNIDARLPEARVAPRGQIFISVPAPPVLISLINRSTNASQPME